MGARKGFGPGLVELIRTKCVPVAIPGGNSHTIQTAGGKVLGSPKPGWNSDLQKGLDEFARLPEADKKPSEVPPYKGFERLPVPPGGLVARLYIRGLEREAQGGLRRYERQSRDYSGPQRDFLWLTEAEWKSLLPASPRKGETFAVPAAVATRLSCHLTGEIVTLGGGWLPEQRRSGEMTLTVEEASSSRIRLGLKGSACLASDADLSKAARKGEFRLLGSLNYDAARKAFDRFDVVALGEYHNANVTDYYVRVGQKKDLTIGIVFELAAPDSLGYGSIPWAIANGIGNAPTPQAIRRYFGSDPYAAKGGRP